jgi:hypothetical protein
VAVLLEGLRERVEVLHGPVEVDPRAHASADGRRPWLANGGLPGEDRAAGQGPPVLPGEIARNEIGPEGR